MTPITAGHVANVGVRDAAAFGVSSPAFYNGMHISGRTDAKGSAVTQTMPTRLHAASGSSEAHDAAEAGRAAATEAMDGLDGRTPALIVVFASVRYDLPTLIGAIRAVTGNTPLVGETSAGHFRGGSLTEPASGVAVLAMTAGPYRFGIALAEKLSGGGEVAGIQLARSAQAALGQDRSPYAAIVVFVDGLAAEQQSLVGGLHQVTGAAVPVSAGRPRTTAT